MLCDICNKKPATVHLTEIIDEQMNELHLCEECARQKSSQMEQQFGLGDLLGGLAEFQKQSPSEKEELALKCTACGQTFEDFKKIGRLGCSECYVSFKKYLGPLLKRIHGSNIHFGKSPVKPVKAARKKTDPADLRLRLQKAIELEDFEEAARIRDQIKELERGRNADKEQGANPEDKQD